MIKAMADQWIIRVRGKEYGPVDIETLREWKNEGRLLPDNEARQPDAGAVTSTEEVLWTTAAKIPGLFSLAAAGAGTAGQLAQPPLQQHRSFAQILAETLRIYRKGFLQFLSLTLLVVLPSACGQLISAWMETLPNANADPRALIAGAFALCMTVLTMVFWPVYIASIQILTVELAAGRRIGFVVAMNEAVRFWPRVALLCIFVYGVFFLLIVFALGIAVMVAAGASSLVVVFLALGLLVLQIWMFGRFFVNVLFWQQFAVLENAGVAESVRESRNLARSGRDRPWFQRPSWQGVLIASIWFAFVLAISLGPEWPTLQHYFNQLATTQDPQALLQNLAAAQQARGFDIFSFALNFVQRILQPLLGIAFVVLYLDSRTRDVESEAAPLEELRL